MTFVVLPSETGIFRSRNLDNFRVWSAIFSISDRFRFGILEAPIQHGGERSQRVALCASQDVQRHTQFIMQLEPRMVALGFMAGRESAVERRRAIGPKGEEKKAEVEEKVKEKRKRERGREKDGAVNRRAPIRGLYSRGMSYMPPAVADALFIARLFIISSSYTYVADPDSKRAPRRGNGVRSLVLISPRSGFSHFFFYSSPFDLQVIKHFINRRNLKKYLKLLNVF